MPKLLTTPFASEATSEYRTDVQNSIGAEPNSATYEQGFPPITMRKINENGKPPKGSDLNGVLYDITDNLVSLTKGARYGFNEAYATAIGGYPLGAVLRLENGVEVESEVDSNSINPNVNMTGWKLAVSDIGIVTWSGRTQMEHNKQSVLSVSTIAEMQNIKDIFNGMTIFVTDQLRGGLFNYSENSSAFREYGTVFDTKYGGGRWLRVFTTREARYFSSILYSLTQGDKTLIIDDQEELDTSIKGRPLLGFSDGISGYSYASKVKGGIDVSSGDSSVSNLKITCENKEGWGVKVQNPSSTNTPQPFLTDIRNTIIRKGNGVLLNGVETNLHNIRVEGRGVQSSQDEENDPIRAKFAFYSTSINYGDKSTGFDLSYSNLFSRGTEVGLKVGAAAIGFDGHFVGCDTAVLIDGTDVFDVQVGQQVHYGLYCDYPWYVGIHLQGKSGASIYNPFIFQLGAHKSTENELAKPSYGIELSGNSRWNLISSPSFRVNDLTKVSSLIHFSDQSTNNIIFGANGSHKMSSDDAQKMRKQTVIGGMGDWAKYNNVPRLCRANTVLLSSEEKTVTICLDYNISINTANITLLKGNYVVRSTAGGGDGAYGDLYVPVGSLHANMKPTFKQVLSTTGINIGLEITSVSVSPTSSYELLITIKNNSTLPLDIAFELQRSVDAKGLTF